ncbi:hypothetical protein BZM26_33595, partial [Paraburkholderia strydomiana]
RIQAAATARVAATPARAVLTEVAARLAVVRAGGNREASAGVAHALQRYATLAVMTRCTSSVAWKRLGT